MPLFSPTFVNGAPWQQARPQAAPTPFNPTAAATKKPMGNPFESYQQSLLPASPTNKPMGNPFAGPEQSHLPQFISPTNKPMQNPFLPASNVSAWQPNQAGAQAPAEMPPELPGLPQQQMMFAPADGMLGGGRQAQPRGGNILEYLAGAQLGNFMGAGQRVADDINGSWGALQQSMTNAADRQERAAERKMRERMFNQLARALGAGGGSDSIQDTSSPLRVGGNTVTTNITAQPLSMADILRADDNVRNTPVGNYDGVRGFYSPGAQGELNQLMQGGVRSNAPNVERIMGDQNAQFGRDIQGARSSQFLGLGGLLAALQGDRISRQGQNVRALMGMIA